MAQLVTPYQHFYDASGTHLNNGYVYVGLPNLNPQTNPVSIYWDEDRTIPAAQPLRTMNGYIVRNGTPSEIYLAELTYSITVLDASRSLVFSTLTTASGGTPDQNLSVTQFGALGDWDGATGTDNLAAFDACFTSAVAIAAQGYGVKIQIPEGRFRLSGEWNIYRSASPRLDIIIEGVDPLATKLVADFAGADKALIKCVDPLGASRASPTSLKNLGFESSDIASPCPTYIDMLGLGESRISGIRMSSCDNTAFRIGSAQNVRMSDIVSYYGGKHFLYKATTGIYFTTTSGGSNIVASDNIFSAGDVGKIISIYPSNVDNRIKYVIATYTSPTEVQVATTTLAATAVTGTFEPARCSMTAASNVLTANAACFVNSDVGRTIYIRRARAGAWGDALLRAKITGYISTSAVSLDTAADNSITEEFFGVPVIDLYRPEGAGVVAAAPNDVKIDLLHVEAYAGIGLVVQDVIFHHLTNFKIHGENTPLDTFASTAHMWLDDFAGELNGEFDGMCMSDARAYFCNFNDLATFTWLATRRTRQEIIFHSELFTDVGGYVNISNLDTYTANSTGTQNLSYDANYYADHTDPRIIYTGFINMLGDVQKPRIHVGRDAYFSPQGKLTPFAWLDDTALTSTVTWNSTAPSGTPILRYRWEQIANTVSFAIRLEYTVAGVTNSSVTVALPTDMPLPKPLFGGGVSDLFSANITGNMATAATGAAPNLTKTYMVGDGAGSYNMVCALNSSTISAAFASFSGFYFTDE